MKNLSGQQASELAHCQLSRHEGCVLLCDVSGFVKVANAHFQELGPKIGAEKTRLWLDRVFEIILNKVAQHNGLVQQFIGDAVVVSFTKQQAEDALQCALQIQHACRQLHTLHNEQKVNVKIALSAGEFEKGTTQHAAQNQLNIILGDVFDRAQKGMLLAGADDVVCSSAFLGQLKPHVQHIDFAPLGNGFHCVKVAHPDTKRAIETAPTPPNKHSETKDSQNEIKLLTVLYFEVFQANLNHKASAEIETVCALLAPLAVQHNASLIGLCQTEQGLRFQYILGSQASKINEVEIAIQFATQAREHLSQTLPAAQTRSSIGYGHAWQGRYGGTHFKLFNAHGREINLAARVLQQTDHNSISLTENARQQLNDKQHVVDHGELDIKGEPAPIRVFRVPVGPQAFEPKHSEHNPLYARDPQLHKVLANLDGALAQQQGCSIEITGPAGVGKSTLVAEIQNVLHQRNTHCPEFRASPHTKLVPYSIAYPLVAALAKLDKAERVETWLVQRLGNEPGLQIWLGLIGLITPLNIPLSDEARNASPDVKNHAIVQLFHSLVKQASASHPLVLFIEDLQWFDRASIRLVTEAMLGEGNVRCVYTIRSNIDEQVSTDLPAMAESASRHHTLKLQPFEPEETELFLKQWFKVGNIPGPLLSALQKLSGGNLLLINALLQRMLQDGVVRRRDREPIEIDYQRLEQLSNIPTTLEHALQARIDLLPTLHRQVLAQCSVFKSAFTLDDLQATMGVNGPESLNESVQALLRNKLIKASLSMDGQSNFRFEHQVIEQCVYDRIPFEERRLLHAKFAQSLEDQIVQEESSQNARLIIRLAAQYAWAGLLDKALPLSQIAIDYACKVGALDEAMERLDTLIKWHDEKQLLNSTPHDLASLIYKKAQIFFTQGHLVNAAESSKAALGVLGYQNQVPEQITDADVSRELGKVHRRRNQGLRPQQHQQNVSREAKLAVPIYTNLGELYFYLGNNNAGHTYLTRGVAIAQNHHVANGDYIKTYVGCVVLAQILGKQQWMPYFTELTMNAFNAIEDEHEKQKAHAYINHRLGYIEFAAGRTELGYAMMCKAVDLAREAGETHTELLAFSCLILIRVFQSRFEDALNLYAHYEALANKYATSYFNIFHQYGVINQKVYCLAMLGRFDEAKQTLKQLQKTASDFNFPKVLMMAMGRCKLMLLYCEKKWDEARAEAVRYQRDITEDVDSKAYYFNCLSVPLEILLEADQNGAPLNAEELEAMQHFHLRLGSVQRKFEVASPIYKILSAQIALRDGDSRTAKKQLKSALKQTETTDQRIENLKAKALLASIANPSA